MILMCRPTRRHLIISIKAQLEITRLSEKGDNLSFVQLASIKPVILGLCHRQWASIGPALAERLRFAGSVDRPHCVSHISGCEDIKAVAQLIETKDDSVTVDI